jgi:hypothetical protein
MISDIIALWKITPPPAPETPALRRLRVRSMVSCLAAALATAAITILVRIHPLAVLVVPVIIVTGVVQTIRYWWIKTLIDEDYAAVLAGNASADEGLQP